MDRQARVRASRDLNWQDARKRARQRGTRTALQTRAEITGLWIVIVGFRLKITGDLCPQSGEECMPCLTLPNDEHLPTCPTQCTPNLLISLGVAIQFGNPVTATRRWNPTSDAAVQMPKTAVHVDDFPQTRKHQIGAARHGSDMKLIMVAHRMNLASSSEILVEQHTMVGSYRGM